MNETEPNNIREPENERKNEETERPGFPDPPEILVGEEADDAGSDNSKIRNEMDKPF
jgi:hypothetical protein